MTFVMTLLVPAKSKFNPSLIGDIYKGHVTTKVLPKEAVRVRKRKKM
jgi:hypothetical protein